LISFASLFIVENSHYLLKIPHVGFVFFNIINQQQVPFFDHRIWNFDKEWLSEGNTIVSSCPKCGTNWLVHTIQTLFAKGKVSEEGLLLISPMAEFVLYPGYPMVERVKDLKAKDTYLTHADPTYFKLNPNVKYVVAFRKLDECLASLRDFLNIVNEDNKKLWGGFPPYLPVKYFETIVKIGGLVDDYAKFYKSWWLHRNEPNVLFVHYSDRIRDQRGSIEEIAEFLQVSLSDSELETVIDVTSFQWMKKNPKRFSFCELNVKLKKLGYVPKEASCFLVEGSLVNKGKDRAGENDLDVSFLKESEERFQNYLHDDTIVHFMKNGRSHQ
jgi:hypothetical protein